LKGKRWLNKFKGERRMKDFQISLSKVIKSFEKNPVNLAKQTTTDGMKLEQKDLNNIE